MLTLIVGLVAGFVGGFLVGRKNKNLLQNATAEVKVVEDKAKEIVKKL